MYLHNCCNLSNLMQIAFKEKLQFSAKYKWTINNVLKSVTGFKIFYYF